MTLFSVYYGERAKCAYLSSPHNRDKSGACPMQKCTENVQAKAKSALAWVQNSSYTVTSKIIFSKEEIKRNAKGQKRSYCMLEPKAAKSLSKHANFGHFT